MNETETPRGDLEMGARFYLRDPDGKKVAEMYFVHLPHGISLDVHPEAGYLPTAIGMSSSRHDRACETIHEDDRLGVRRGFICVDVSPEKDNTAFPKEDQLADETDGSPLTTLEAAVKITLRGMITDSTRDMMLAQIKALRAERARLRGALEAFMATGDVRLAVCNGKRTGLDLAGRKARAALKGSA